ncbi:MAG: response regulator transcription factor [Chloroflexota bacterium]|nr:response regulator transcription factor [Chloroflexota bacterium]
MATPTAPIRLAIVEDEHLYRDLLRTVLQLDTQLEVVGDYATAQEALDEVPRVSPGVALLDIELGGSMNGVQLGLLLREKLPDLGIVLLSNVRAPRLLASIPQAQVSGWSYLLKKSVRDARVLRRAIDGAGMGLVTLDPSLVAGRHPRDHGALSAVTPRQLEILSLVAEGWSNDAIAQRLGLSVKTVENQLTLTYGELGLDRDKDPVHPRVKAVLLYLAETRETTPLVDPPQG